MEGGSNQVKKCQKDLRPNYSLYRKYVEPQSNYIRFLVMHYANNKNDANEYYHLATVNLCKYIHTYDSSRPLKTWIHVAVKRLVYSLNKRDAAKSQLTDKNFNGDFDFHGGSVIRDELLSGGDGDCGENILDNVSDETMAALKSISAVQLSAFLLYYQGYSFEEIVKIENERGVFPVKTSSVSTVANRVYAAKRKLREELSKCRVNGR